MAQAKQELKRQELTVAEIEALEAIELPSREAMTGLTIGGAICLSVNVNVGINLDLGGDCASAWP